jgi:hypothetical protein
LINDDLTKSRSYDDLQRSDFASPQKSINDPQRPEKVYGAVFYGAALLVAPPLCLPQPMFELLSSQLMDAQPRGVHLETS